MRAKKDNGEKRSCLRAKGQIREKAAKRFLCTFTQAIAQFDRLAKASKTIRASDLLKVERSKLYLVDKPSKAQHSETSKR